MKNFKLNIIVRVLVITLLLGTALYFFLVDARYLRATYFLVFAIIGVIELVYYNIRTNRDISTFLLSLLQHDFTTTFHGHAKGRSFGQMYDTFNQVTERFKELSVEQEARHHYLEALIQHVQIGLVSFDDGGKVHMVNETFCRFGGVEAIRHLDDLERHQPELLGMIRTMRAGEDQVVRLTTENGLVPLNIHMTRFILDGMSYHLVSVQNIRQALDRQEMESYQKLIRVLTHEIMNSVSPISSLSESLAGIVTRADRLEGSNLKNVEMGLEAIRVRSKGLETFTEAYKRLTRVPQPHIERISLNQLVERVVRLIDDNGIVVVDIPEEITINADGRQIEQVLINLLKNAREAVEQVKSPAISIRARKKEPFAEVEIRDNGEGIPADKLDKIFIPFFTTKAGGSGIGLAVSRQIMKMHGGSISVDSSASGTMFRLVF